MAESDLETKLQHAFHSGLKLPNDIDYQKLEFAKTSQWDSIAHLQLIAAIESEFGIMISTNDMLAMSSFTKAIEIVKKYEPVLS